MTIHREGYALLVFTGLILIIINVLLYHYNILAAPWTTVVVVLSGILFLLILQFFRNPRINLNPDHNLVYAPANGKIVVIEQALEKEYFNQSRIQISIFMSPLDVHVNRNPVSGKVKRYTYHAGKYLVAWHPKSSTENERTTLVVENTNGIDILIRQIAGAMARRIKCYVGEGDQVVQGQEFGFIRFGSRVDLFLPLDADIKVSLGQHTKAGKTIIAQLAPL